MVDKKPEFTFGNYLILETPPDTPYIKGILDLSRWSNLSLPMKEEFPLKTFYYICYAMRNSSPELFKEVKNKRNLISLTTDDICEIYCSQWHFLYEQYENGTINKDQHWVAQDVIDRYLLNVYFQNPDAEIRNAFVERWKPLLSKIGRAHV